MPPRAGKKPAPHVAAKIDDKPGERQVVYPEIEARVAVGDEAITVELMKELLGWCEDQDTAKRHGCFEPHLTDRKGNKVWLLNNVTNRPIYGAVWEALVQEHLNRKWQFNGEPIIIGRTGLVLNGQHTGISLVIAEQDRTSEKDRHHWAEFWPGPVTMEKLIVFGVDEGDATVNTMDTCKPRSFADVIYRSEFFKDCDPPLSAGVLNKLGKLTQAAVVVAWNRTGAGVGPYPLTRTHAEGLDFIKRHPRLLDAVRYVQSEDTDGAVQKGSSVPPGTAAALLYLMGSSASDLDAYSAGNPPREELMDFAHWDRACEFWGLLAGGSRKMAAVKQGLALLANPDGPDVGRYNNRTREEEIAVVVKAWGQFLQGDHLDVGGLALDFVSTDEGDGLKSYVLNETPLCGGVDLGKPKEQAKAPPAPKEKPTPKVKAAPATRKEKDTPEGLQAELAALHEQHPDRVLLFKAGNGVIMHGPDCKEAGKVLDKKPAKDNNTGMLRMAFPVEELDKCLVKMVGHGLKVAVITSVKDADGKSNMTHEYYPTPERVELHEGTTENGGEAEANGTAPEVKSKPAPKSRANGAAPKPTPKPKAKK